jgi:hypothetical protein
VVLVDEGRPYVLRVIYLAHLNFELYKVPKSQSPNVPTTKQLNNQTNIKVLYTIMVS